jgi:FkbM family methyltransferase
MIKKIIYKLLNILKIIIPYNIKTYIKKKKSFNSLNNLDKKMLKYINYRNGFFIECGANDGVNQSNTWHFEKKLDWRGVLIEPLSKQFKELKNNRKNINHFFNVALVDDNYNKDEIELIDLDLTSKFKLYEKQVNQPLTSILVKTKTLTNILDECESPKIIDFFSLDVEGAEFTVLNGINYNRYNFRYILIETKNFQKIDIFLKSNNYKLLDKLSHHDYLYKYEKNI